MISVLDLPFSVFDILKWFYVFAFFLYVIFSLVVVKQVKTMNRTLEVNFEGPLFLISYIHLFFAVGVFIFALFIL